MDLRTRILLGVFGLAGAYALGSTLVYPRWVVPLLTRDEEIEQRQAELDKLEEGEARADQAKREYRYFAERVGSFRIRNVENRLRERLNQLIETHGLRDANTSPGRTETTRKTGLEYKTITVTGVATLESAIGFLTALAELPELIRIETPAIYPARSSRKDGDVQMVNIRVPLKVMVVPQHKLVGRIVEEDIIQPESEVRHQGRNYSAIWERAPLTPYVPPKPLIASAGRDLTLKEGAKAVLPGKVSGGDGNIAILWEGEGLSDPTLAEPFLDTSMLGSRVYKLTVKDGTGQTATDSVRVTIVAKKQEIAKDPPPPPDNRWKNRRQLQLCMALLRSEGDTRLDEFMVYNTKTKENSYYEVGSEFDGGELVFVHQRGGVVRRQDEYFVYPIGAKLDQDLKMEEAQEHPTLQGIARQLHQAELADSAVKEPEEETQGDEGEAEEDGAAASSEAKTSSAEASPDSSAVAPETKEQRPDKPDEASNKGAAKGPAASSQKQTKGRPKEARSKKARNRSKGWQSPEAAP